MTKKQNKILKLFLAGSALGLISGCAAIPLSPGAQAVQMRFQPPAKNCKFMGYVQGAQGGFFTGGWTSNSNLQQGAANDLRNKAFAMGANYVELLGDKAQTTSSYSASGAANPYASSYSASGGTQVTNNLMNGNAFKCPPQN